ncbi:E3 ubiquitin-protein ligase FANCL-like, partial [Tropilaelaps mercedesae]
MDMTYDMLQGRVLCASIPQELLAENPALCQPREVADAFAVFKDLVNKLEPFYQSLRSLDSSAWIVDPSDLRQFYRRVVLEDSLALQITFTNPLHPGKPPL